MILIDNTVLSNFALIQHPEFIRQAFVENVATTEYVVKELEVGMKIGRLPVCDWIWLARITLTDDEEKQFLQLSAHLGRGEASCLAVAVHRKSNLATDDRNARQWAVRLAVPHTGTLGILATLVKQNSLSLQEGNHWLEEMLMTGYHSPLKTLDQLIS